MADPKFDETSPVDFDDTEAIEAPSFDDTVDAEAEPESKKTEAFLGGAFQDLSLGTMDEIKGALEAAGQSVGIKGLGQEFGKQELTTPLAMTDKTLEEAYREGRDLERQRIADLQSQEEGAFQAGEIAGMIGPTVATGGAGAIQGLLKKGSKEAAKLLAKEGAKEGLEQATKGETKKQLAKLAGSGATMGGVGAAGYSETEALQDPVELAKEIGTGAGVGTAVSLATPAATKVATKAIKTAGKALREGSKQITAIMGGLKKGEIDEIIARADDLKDVKDYPEIQEIIVDKARSTLSQIGQIGKKASELLSSEKNIPKDTLRKRLNDRILKINNTADDAAIPQLQKIQEAINDEVKFGGELISMQDLHTLVQDIGKRAYQGVSKDAPGAVKKQLRETYREMSELLKEAAPENYRKFSKEMSDRYNKLGELEKKLGIKVDFDDIILESEDKLARKIQEVGKTDPSGREKTDIENLLNELEELTGRKPDEKALSDMLRARRLEGELEKGASEYSYVARTLVGSALGAGAGGTEGASVGALAGLGARPITRSLLKKSGKLGRAKISERASKFVDNAEKLGAPLGLAAGVTSGTKVAVDDTRTATKLEDPKYLEGLMEELRESGVPGGEVYANQLERYSETEDEQQKTQIQFNLAQQPAFRELLEEYDKTKKK